MIDKIFTKDCWFRPRLQCLMPEKKEVSELLTKQIAVRIVIGLITGAWIASLPGYLAVIYMQQNGFFSYDFLIDAVYAQSIFIVAASLLFLGLSMVLYGAVIWLMIGLAERRDSKRVTKDSRILFWFFVIFSAVSHAVIIDFAFRTDEPLAVLPPLVLCLLVAIFISSYVGRDMKSSLGDWFRPALLLVFTVAVPIIQPHVTAGFVATGLSMFKVGGGVHATIRSKTDSPAIVTEGRLLLLGPATAYVRKSDGRLVIVPVNDNTVVEVSGTPKMGAGSQ
ncbi:MAG: hypothetical protein PHY62_10990 [Gallionella sp.]|nr:hypothetical protein [Gallionella sp.]